MTLYLDMLAQLPESTTYVHPVKLGVLALGYTLWVLFAQWVDKDTIAVNTYRELWNLIVLGTGVVAAVLALFVPIFWLGFLLFAVIELTVFLSYVVHRNKLVQPQDTVLTRAHYHRVKEQGLFGKKKRKVVEVKEKVRLTGADKNVVPIPDDNPEREQYRLTQDLLFDALWRRASHVKLAPAGEVMKIAYTIDGVPTQRDPVPREEGDAIIQFAKRIAGLNLDERRKPQRGQFLVAVGEHKFKTMVQSGGTTAGELLALRIVRGEENLKAPDLGFTPKQLEAVTAAREEPNGLILVTAPSESGLTTTIYSLTRTHDRFLQNVQMIEYEKELGIDNVTQKVFDPAGGMSFADMLTRLVRADPDVIVLPELRDRESAYVAAQAAVKKQKVYVGLSANDVFDALSKWMQMVGDAALVAKSLLAISNQRLIRLLCSECKQAYKPDPQMMRKLNLPADKNLYRPPEQLLDKKGNPIICQACQGTGYVGRTAVFEWLAVDDALREAIRTSRSMAEIQSQAVKRGGIGLQAQALHKVLEGKTSIQEVVRAVRGQPANAGKRPAGPSPKPKSRGPAGPSPTPKPRPGAGGPRKPAAGGSAS